MEWKKLKRIILLMLLAANLFLIGNIAFLYYRAVRSETFELKNALALLPADQKLTMDAFSALPRYLYSYSGQRCTEDEKLFAESFLPAGLSVSEAGGGVSIYSSASFTVTFRRGGSVEGFIECDSAGFFDALSVKGLEKTVVNNSLLWSFRGYPVAGSSLSAENAGSVLAFKGSLPITEGWSRGEKTRGRGELAIAISAYMTKEKTGALLSLEQVYRLAANGSRELTLFPAIRVSCENGTFYINQLDKTIVYSAD